MPKKKTARSRQVPKTPVKKSVKKTTTKKSVKKSVKRTSPAPSKQPAQPTTIKSFQSAIQQLDRELVRSISRRAELVRELAELRSVKGEPTISFEREANAVGETIWSNDGPISDDHMQSIFRDIVSACRSTVRRHRVAFLGPLYSYSHLAVLRRFGGAIDFSPVGNIAAVFEEVQHGTSEFGIVPIENSTDGRIVDTLDMFTRMPIRICGQIDLPIHHTLLGIGQRDQIREVYSKPQALSQCRNWIARHLPQAKTIEVASTTVAAQIAKNMDTAAAVASREAGLQYGLNILAEKIEDQPDNVTRFAVIGDHTSEPSGDDRTALFFQTEHRFGALADALADFKKAHINLTWIESFPVPGPDRTYLFFAELEGHEQEPMMRKTLDALRRKCLRLEILGSFPACESE